MEQQIKHEIIGQFSAMVASIAGNLFTPEQNRLLSSVKLDDWVDGKHVREAIDAVGQADADRARNIGRSFSYSLKEEYVRRGVNDPVHGLEVMTELYATVNRGDEIGAFEIVDRSENRVLCREDSPYNCDFTEGIFIGVVRNFGGRNVRVEQTECRRRGASHCLYNVTWE